jgi:glutamine cyclotransferase
MADLHLVALTSIATLLAAAVSCTSDAAPGPNGTSNSAVVSPPGSSATPSRSAGTPLTGPKAMPLPAGTRRLRIDDAAAFVPMSGPYDLAITANAVWTAGGPYRIDPKTNAVGQALTDQGADVVAADSNSVWASAFAGNTVRRFDAHTGRLAASVTLPGDDASPDGIAITRAGVWVAAHHGGALYRIDPRTNALIGRVPVADPGSSGPEFLTAGARSIWVGVPSRDDVVRLDVRSGKVLATIPTGGRIVPSGDLTVTRQAIWMSESFAGTHIARIDLHTNKITSVIDTGGYVVQPAADGDAVWFVTGGRPGQSPRVAAYLVKMQDNGTIARRYALGDSFQPGGLVIGFGSIWVSSTSQPIVLRIPYPRS